MALYNNPYQYSFGVPGQMNQFQQPVQMPAQQVQQSQQNNNGILWVSGEVGAKSYLVAPGTSVLLMDSESEKFYIKSTDVSGMPQPLRTFEYHEVGTQMPPKQPVQNMDSKYVTRQEYDDLKGKYEAIINRLNSFSEPFRANNAQESAAKGDYVRGHYSRSDGRDAYDDYMTQKQSYRSGKSEDCKRKMLAALEEHLDELTTEMSDMSKDAECREERDLVKRYVEKLRDML